MQITASDAISTISARTSCVIRSGMLVGLTPMKEEWFPFEHSSNPRQRNSGVDRSLGWCQTNRVRKVKTMTVNDRLKMPTALFSKKPPRRYFLRVPRWVRSILGIPLEMKLLGANLIIVGVAVLLFGAVPIEPARLADTYVFVVALIVGAAVNFALVKVALGPIDALERVARRVSEGRLSERVPASLVADSGLTRVSTTINAMLHSLEAGRDRMRKLGAEVVYAEEKERAQVARELHDSVGQTLAAARDR